MTNAVEGCGESVSGERESGRPTTQCLPVVGSRRNRGWKNSDSANREASSCAARIAAPILAGGNMPEVNSVQRNSSDMIPTAISPYKTTELELASFLKARSYRLLDARMVGRIVTFEFEQGAAEDVNAYFAGTEVSARELFVSNTEAMSDKAYHTRYVCPAAPSIQTAGCGTAKWDTFGHHAFSFWGRNGHTSRQSPQGFVPRY